MLVGLDTASRLSFVDPLPRVYTNRQSDPPGPSRALPEKTAAELRSVHAGFKTPSIVLI